MRILAVVILLILFPGNHALANKQIFEEMDKFIEELEEKNEDPKVYIIKQKEKPKEEKEETDSLPLTILAASSLVLAGYVIGRLRKTEKAPLD